MQTTFIIKKRKKSRIAETLNLPACADSSTTDTKKAKDIFMYFLRGGGDDGDGVGGGRERNWPTEEDLQKHCMGRG